MLHIILTILKIIGLLLLVLFAILILIAGTVLFVPVRYRADGNKDDTGWFVKAEVYWLFRLLRVKAVYPEPGRITAKFLWFTLYDSRAEEEPEKEKKKRQRKDKRKKEKQKAEKEKTEEQKAGKEKAGKAEKAGEGERKETKENHGRGAEEKYEKPAETENEDVSPNSGEETAKNDSRKGVRYFFIKIKTFFMRIFLILQNIKYTICRLCDKIKEICANIRYYAEVFEEEETKRAFAVCGHRLYKIWKNIRPKKCRAELKLGTGEPDTTGYILAVHGILYPLLGNTVYIEPDFENRILEGTFSLKGRITIFVLLHAAWKIYFDKDIRHFLKRFKREE